MTTKVNRSSNQELKTIKLTKKGSVKKPIDVAKAMKEYAENNTGAIGKDGFTALLKQVNKDNVVNIIKRYDAISPDKSIIGMILGEIGSNDEEMEMALVAKGNGKTQVRGLFTLLLDKAKSVGVDEKTISTYRKEFEDELYKQLGNDGFFSQIRSLVYIDSTRLDTIMRAMVQTIDNQTTLSQADTNNIIGKRYNQAYKDFNEQLAKDGWTGDVADFWGKMFSENNADAVRADLKKCKKQYDELVVARKQGDEAYKAKFKEIFGVVYNPSNIKAYQNAEARYIEASKANAQEADFKSRFSVLLNDRPLQDEYVEVTSPTTGTRTRILNARKQQVYEREYKHFVNLLGEGGATVIKEKFKEAGVENKSIDEKFKVLQKLAKVISTNLHAITMKATGGAAFDAVQRHYDNCYKAAFGLKNDILKRINDYNISQQEGSDVVKTAVITSILIGSTLTGQIEGIGAAAWLSAGLTAAVEVTDAATQKRNLDFLKKGDIAGYMKSFGKNTDWYNIAKATLTLGVMMLAIGGVSYPIANLCRVTASSVGLTGKALTMATGLGTNAVVTGGVLGSQYLMKGEITTKDGIFAVVMVVVGSTIQVIQINKAYANADNATLEEYTQNIQNARRTLGFDDGVEITPDMLKQQFKKMVLANHPDKGGTAINMTVINSAKDYLQTHIADINIALTGSKPQTINSSTKAQTKAIQTLNTEEMSELAKTPEGVKQMEDAGLVVSKASIDKLGTIHEGQS